MAEKRGSTGKLIYDFPTEAVLEVKMKGKWFRTTARDFRSFDGERRYTKPIKQPGIGDNMFDVPDETIVHRGNLYAFESNEILPKLNTNKIYTNESWKKMMESSVEHTKFKI